MSVRSRDGFALPLALVILVASSMMVAASLQVSLSDFHANRATRVSARALYAAEAGAQKTMALWETLPYEAMAPGDSVASGWVPLPDGSSFQSVVARVDDGSSSEQLFRMLTEGRPHRESTSRRLVLTMLRSGGGGGGAWFDAVLSAYGRLDVESEGAGRQGWVWGGWGVGFIYVDERSGGVDGRDHVPSGWDAYCPVAGPDVGGVKIRRLDDLDVDDDALVYGTPPTQQDDAMTTDLVRTLAGTTYDALAARADIRLTGNNERLDDVRPRASGGTCSRHRENWGAPESPGSTCWGRLPIIHATRNLTLEEEGTGQGILLVDGNLDVLDEFHFYGLVVVKGTADFNDETALRGALLVANRDQLNQRSRVRDEAVVRYSSCALARVLPSSSGGTGVSLLPGRHWFELP